MAGVQIENESLVNLPNWLSLKFRIDGGDWFDVDTAETCCPTGRTWICARPN